MAESGVIRILSYAAILVVFGCSSEPSRDGELSRDEAAYALEEHFQAVLPSFFATAGHWIAVDEIVNTSDSTRRVRFTADFSRGTRMRRGSSGPSFEADFRRGASGWTPSAYGPGLADYVARMVDAGWYEGYRPLTKVVRDISWAEYHWYWRLISEAYRFPTLYNRRVEQLLEKARAGIPLDTFYERLARRGFSAPDSVEWGISPPGRGGTRVIWARFRDDSDTVCGSPYGGTGPFPTGYRWVTDALTCKGGEPPIYVRSEGWEAARARIAQGGGILRR